MDRVQGLAASTSVTLTLAIGFSLSTWNAVAVADVLILKNGSIIEGRCLNAADKNATDWQVETGSGMRLLLSRSDVKEIRPVTADQKKYTEIVAKIGDDDSLETHRKFVEWCNEKLLQSLAEAHTERIVELDPSDKTAWAALGYVSTDQGWTRKDLYQKRRGLEQKGTRWYVPQDLAIQNASAKAKEQVAKVSQDVMKAVANVKTKSPKAAEARQYLAQLADPLAVPKIRELLDKDRGNKNPQFRLQMIEILGRIRSGNAVDVLIAYAITDPDPKVRSECVLRLSEFGREAAIESFLVLLTNRQPEKDKPEVYDRIGEAMAVLGDERCIERLLDCLVTDHIRVPPPQPANQAVQQSNGNVNFSQGQPKPEKIRMNNDGILSALQTISNGEHFGFDVQAWRNWYAATYAAPNKYVSRDP